MNDETMSAEDIAINAERAGITAALVDKADDDVVVLYEAEKNPTGAAVVGAPLRDLTAHDVRSMPDWMQRSVFAAPFYVIVN